MKINWLLPVLLILIITLTAGCRIGYSVSFEIKPEELSILIMGDSLIAKSSWVEEFSELLKDKYRFTYKFNIYKSAKSGDLAEDGRENIGKNLLRYDPDIVILAYGTNDVNVTSTRDYYCDMEYMIVKSHASGAQVFINLIGPFEPTALKGKFVDYNDEIFKLANKYNIRTIDVLTPLSKNTEANLADHTHYSYSGATIVADTVFDCIASYLK